MGSDSSGARQVRFALFKLPSHRALKQNRGEVAERSRDVQRKEAGVWRDGKASGQPASVFGLRRRDQSTFNEMPRLCWKNEQFEEVGGEWGARIPLSCSSGRRYTVSAN